MQFLFSRNSKMLSWASYYDCAIVHSSVWIQREIGVGLIFMEKYASKYKLFFFQDMKGLECGHRFCAQCWAEYLTSKIMDEGMGQTISCAAYGCDILVDDKNVM